MTNPLILICGPAGSGKDTFAAFLAKHTGGVTLAQADPMKCFSRDVFGFTDHQLWGPSEARNEPDSRYDMANAWAEAQRKLCKLAPEWIRGILPELGGLAQDRASDSLVRWFHDTRMARGGSGRPPLTPRYVLQTLGTEWGRSVSATMWNDCAIRTATKKIDEGAPCAIITDGRFRNEVLGVKRAGGAVIQIMCPAAGSIDGAGVHNHRSETELATIPWGLYNIFVNNDKSKGLVALENVSRQVQCVLFPDAHHFETADYT